MERIILAADREQADRAARWGKPLAHLAYRVGPEGRLLRLPSAVPPQGGWMGVDCRELASRSPADSLRGELLRECTLRGFRGAVLRLPSRARDRLAPRLAPAADAFRERGWELFVPESYGAALPQAGVLIPTALSGGSYRERLAEAAGRFGAERLALWVERVAQDFLLPSPLGVGRPLGEEELDRLRRENAVFFSRDLCARYLTFMTGETGHFVLFDDAGTVREKLTAASGLGIGTAFLPYRETESLLGELFGRS